MKGLRDLKHLNSALINKSRALPSASLTHSSLSDAASWFEFWGLGFGFWVFGFGVWGLGFGVLGFGFGIWGFGS